MFKYDTIMFKFTSTLFKYLTILLKYDVQSCRQKFRNPMTQELSCKFSIL